MLILSLKLNPRHKKSIRQLVAEFDFVGLVLVLAGVVCLLLGFNESGSSCRWRLCVAPRRLTKCMLRELSCDSRSSGGWWGPSTCFHWVGVHNKAVADHPSENI
jgi:hypothetical protein